MTTPILVDVFRGGRVESAHRGSLCVADATGAVVLALGDIDRPVFPRSAVKAFQALPLVESGAADRFSLTDEELALACASHSGEPAHVDQVTATLAKAGLRPADLGCGTHWPGHEGAARALAAAGFRPCQTHNNCSGKHAGFLCTAVHLGQDVAGYTAPEHPAMRAVTTALEEMTGTRLGAADAGTDGCNIPTFAIPLKALAQGFARFGTGHGLGPERARAAERLRAAVAAAPFFVAGTKRFDTVAMEAFGARAFIKTGAEGVYCGALPEKGLGFALKIEDGAARAAEVAAAALLAAFLPLDDAEENALSPLLRPELRNWNGTRVGHLAPAQALQALPA